MSRALRCVKWVEAPGSYTPDSGCAGRPLPGAIVVIDNVNAFIVGSVAEVAIAPVVNGDANRSNWALSFVQDADIRVDVSAVYHGGAIAMIPAPKVAAVVPFFI